MLLKNITDIFCLSEDHWKLPNYIKLPEFVKTNKKTRKQLLKFTVNKLQILAQILKEQNGGLNLSMKSLLIT